MKIELELKINGDGRKFLNFWNHVNGDDVVCEIVDGKLISDNGDGPEITFQEFVEQVDDKTKTWKL